MSGRRQDHPDPYLHDKPLESVEFIVFIESPDVKFLKHWAGFQSPSNSDVLMSSIGSTVPTRNAGWSVKDFPLHKRKY
jgi:hypothetical protein